MEIGRYVGTVVVVGVVGVVDDDGVGAVVSVVVPGRLGVVVVNFSVVDMAVLTGAVVESRIIKYVL